MIPGVSGANPSRTPPRGHSHQDGIAKIRHPGKPTSGSAAASNTIYGGLDAPPPGFAAVGFVPQGDAARAVLRIGRVTTSTGGGSVTVGGASAPPTVFVRTSARSTPSLLWKPVTTTTTGTTTGTTTKTTTTPSSATAFRLPGYPIAVGPFTHVAAERDRLASLSWRHFDVRQLGSTVGGEISGVDLTAELPDDVIDELRQALHDYKVIFFRDQPLDPAPARGVRPTVRRAGDPPLPAVQHRRARARPLREDGGGQPGTRTRGTTT